jgi:hypothetical protein
MKHLLDELLFFGPGGKAGFFSFKCISRSFMSKQFFLFVANNSKKWLSAFYMNKIAVEI